MDQIRAFIAIEMPEQMQERLQSFESGLRRELKDMPIRWVPARNIHLTLKFLGQIPEASVGRISDALQTICAPAQTFELTVSGLGVFPNASKPRVIWLGIQSPEALHSLQQEIELAMQGLGYQAETRRFSPHLTLGRVRRSASSAQRKHISEIVLGHGVSFEESLSVGEIALMKSTLKSDGARYSRLFAATIKSENVEV